jgi:hypothetical protein
MSRRNITGSFQKPVFSVQIPETEYYPTRLNREWTLMHANWKRELANWSLNLEVSLVLES